MITGPLCRAARALVEFDRARLAQFSGIEAASIEAFERKIGRPDDETVAALQAALERAGAVFIPENGGGVGVRLKFTRSEARRIAVLEGEGGPARTDDVP